MGKGRLFTCKLVIWALSVLYLVSLRVYFKHDICWYFHLVGEMRHAPYRVAVRLASLLPSFANGSGYIPSQLTTVLALETPVSSQCAHTTVTRCVYDHCAPLDSAAKYKIQHNENGSQ